MKLTATSPRSWQSLAPLLTFVVALALYHFVFGNFYPNRSGAMGGDYSYVLPMLFAGRYWYEANGPLSIPWFTPTICGGVPLLADPQSFYYSIPQWLAFVMNPLAAAYATVLIFAAIGYWGFFVLARRSFACGQTAATVGATLFMFNGFFAYAMIIGHFVFHGFMLVPWIAHAVLANSGNTSRGQRFTDVRNGIIAGLFGAYWIYSGMLSVLIPAALAVASIICVHAAYFRTSISLRTFITRVCVAMAVVTGVSACKLVGAFAYLAAFPRASYRLPGMDGVWHTAFFIFQSLFLSQSDLAVYVSRHLVNVQWDMGRHGLEFGIGFAAFVILIWGAWFSLPRDPAAFAPRNRRIALTIVAALILALPLALNTYSPAWNAFLKQVPVIGSSSNLFRWFIIFIPFFVLLDVLIVERTPVRFRAPFAIGMLLLLAGQILATDRRSYDAEYYRPDRILAAYERLKSGAAIPPIDAIRLRLPSNYNGMADDSPMPNEHFIFGRSALACYNPIFGYRLEDLPVRTLHEGPVEDEIGGALNLKNPACYIYPTQNACRPGDHFRVNERDDMIRFASYRPYPFKQSVLQTIANWTSALTLLIALALLAAGSWRSAAKLRRADVKTQANPR